MVSGEQEEEMESTYESNFNKRVSWEAMDVESKRVRNLPW